jgi:hypothetical protein
MDQANERQKASGWEPAHWLTVPEAQRLQVDDHFPVPC